MKKSILILTIAMLFTAIGCSTRKMPVIYNPEIIKEGYMTYIEGDHSPITGRVIYNQHKDTLSISEYKDGKSVGNWFVIYGSDTVLTRNYYDLYSDINSISKYKFKWIEVFSEKNVNHENGDLVLYFYDNEEINKFINQDLEFPTPEYLFFKNILLQVNEILKNKYEVGFVKYYSDQKELFSNGYPLTSPKQGDVLE